MAERWERAAHYYKSLTLYVNKADCCKLKLYPINPKIMTKIIMNKINILANKRDKIGIIKEFQERKILKRRQRTDGTNHDKWRDDRLKLNNMESHYM